MSLSSCACDLTGRCSAGLLLPALSVLCFLSPNLAAQVKSESYVGSKACSGCHSAIYRSFAQTDMGRSMTLARDWLPAAVPAQATINQQSGQRLFSVTRQDGSWSQIESQPGVFSVAHDLAFAVGSGTNGVTFLIRRGSYLFQAPLSFYTRAGKWDLSPGYEGADLGFNRKVPEECINCHAGRSSPLPEAPAAYADPPFRELAIGCENCHGPGDRHVLSAGRLASAIVNPAKLPARLAEDICMNCHQAGDARVLQPGKNYRDFRPGEWLFNTAVTFKQPARAGDPQADLLEHFSAMRASRCFRESAGKLSCLTCHDPHTQPRKDEVAAYYRPKCLACHAQHPCRLPLKERTAQSPPDNCVGCHMPKRQVAQISHSALTNHRIPARESEPLAAIQQDQLDGLVVVDPPGTASMQLSKGMLLRAYQQIAPQNPEYRQRYLDTLNSLGDSQTQDPYVLAALGDRAYTDGHLNQAISFLEQALPLGTPGLYLELAQALAKAGRNEEAMKYLEKGTTLDPYDALLQKTLILEYINRKAYAAAQSRMQAYVEEFPEDTLMRSLLARVSR